MLYKNIPSIFNVIQENKLYNKQIYVVTCDIKG